MFQHQSETRGEMTSLIDEMLGNQKIVQAFAHEEEAQQHPLQLLHIIAVRRQPQKARVGFSYLGHAWILAQKAMCLQIPAA